MMQYFTNFSIFWMPCLTQITSCLEGVPVGPFWAALTWAFLDKLDSPPQSSSYDLIFPIVKFMRSNLSLSLLPSLDLD